VDADGARAVDKVPVAPHMPILDNFLRSYTTKIALECSRYSAKTHAPGFFGQYPTYQAFHHDTALEICRLWKDNDFWENRLKHLQLASTQCGDSFTLHMPCKFFLPPMGDTLTSEFDPVDDGRMLRVVYGDDVSRRLVDQWWEFQDREKSLYAGAKGAWGRQEWKALWNDEHTVNVVILDETERTIALASTVFYKTVESKPVLYIKTFQGESGTGDRLWNACKQLVKVAGRVSPSSSNRFVGAIFAQTLKAGSGKLFWKKTEMEESKEAAFLAIQAASQPQWFSTDCERKAYMVYA